MHEMVKMSYFSEIGRKILPPSVLSNLKFDDFVHIKDIAFVHG